MQGDKTDTTTCAYYLYFQGDDIRCEERYFFGYAIHDHTKITDKQDDDYILKVDERKTTFYVGHIRELKFYVGENLIGTGYYQEDLETLGQYMYAFDSSNEFSEKKETISPIEVQLNDPEAPSTAKSYTATDGTGTYMTLGFSPPSAMNMTANISSYEHVYTGSPTQQYDTQTISFYDTITFPLKLAGNVFSGEKTDVTTSGDAVITDRYQWHFGHKDLLDFPENTYSDAGDFIDALSGDALQSWFNSALSNVMNRAESALVD